MSDITIRTEKDMTGNPILEVKDLNVSYGQSKVLFDVSLKAYAKEVVGVVGRNGAGKTTLMKTIGGFLKPSCGSVTFKGEDIVGLRSYEIVRKGLKYIPQDKGVFSDLTVMENLQLSSYAMRDYDWGKVTHYFPKLQQLMNRKGAYLSGGERQMLMIGRAILGKPDVLLLDEPTEGLSPSVVQDLARTFKELKDSMALVLVEQNLSVVAEVADRLYIMREGRISAEVSDAQDIKTLSFEKYLL
ncbi:MAG: ABC transporter ATP-binding protein [Clostridia bacterium]